VVPPTVPCHYLLVFLLSLKLRKSQKPDLITLVKAAAHSIYFERKLNFGEGLVLHALDVLLKKEDKMLAR
jgi:hypothetical protein